MVELLALIKDILMPFILSYGFITITGYVFLEGIVDSYFELIEKKGYKNKILGNQSISKLIKFVVIIQKVINPVVSLSLIMSVLSNDKNISDEMFKQGLDDGSLIPKENKLDNKIDDSIPINKEMIKDDSNIKTISNNEKIEFLENEKKFLMDSKQNNDDMIDKYVYTKKL